MTTSTENGYTTITADMDKFLANADMTIYSEVGGSIILGINDLPENYRELPASERPVVEVEEREMPDFRNLLNK